MTAPVAVPKVRFYELNEQRAVLETFLVETEGEETKEIGELWAQLTGDAENKATNWAKFNKERALEGKLIEAMEAPLKAELARLVSERKAIENAVDRSRRELSRQMRLYGLEKVKKAGISIWHVDEDPIITMPAIDALTPEDLDGAYELGVARRVPECTVITPAHWEWDAEEIVRKAAQLEALTPEERKQATPLPPGVSVMFRKGIRIR